MYLGLTNETVKDFMSELRMKPSLKDHINAC
uniref:Uncharacterized protein n=1 Tax=Anguilla anguilla TaxID=7936 RepID=A0A0E9SXI1_ANGAN